MTPVTLRTDGWQVCP